MKNFSIKRSPEERIRNAIYDSMKIYVSRLIEHTYEFGNESSFQLHFSSILERMLELNTYSSNECFSISLEKNYPIKGRKDEVDISVVYRNKQTEKTFLIEMKNKKITDSASDDGNIFSYIDMYNLNTQLYYQNENNIGGAFFIFLTDLQTYTNKPINGTRAELPMDDGVKIEKGRKYFVSGQSAREKTVKYPDGFVFNKDYEIEYIKFFVDKKPFWYFIVEI